MSYEVAVYNFSDHPTLQAELIEQIQGYTQIMVVIDYEKNDCIHVSPNANRDMYQAEAIKEALNKLETKEIEK